MPNFDYIRSLSSLRMTDIGEVGGKSASLGEMLGELRDKGIRVPDGFAIVAQAYWDFLEHNNLRKRIEAALDNLDVRDIQALAQTGAAIRGWILDGELPPKLTAEITQAYAELAGPGGDTAVAVRSSATAEDLPTASFAGQQETYLNVQGIKQLLRMCRRVLASLFTDRAISYRVDHNFGHMEVALSVGVQKIVRSDRGASGVMFTLETESGFPDLVMITGAYGLGETVVQGAVNPDEFFVYKNTLSSGYRPIIRRHLGDKAIKMVMGNDPITGDMVKTVAVEESERHRFTLSDDEVLQLARMAVIIEDHYSKKAGGKRPMDIEWAKDGISGELFIVQARPETVHSNRRPTQEIFHLQEQGLKLTSGKSIGTKIGAGKVHVILDAAHMNELQPGEVLVTDMTDPDWEPAMKVASAVVTNRGGRVCHAAIVARELGIPAIVGTGNATTVLINGNDITASCAEGEVGYVYSGLLKFSKTTVDLSTVQKPKTQIMLIVGNPAQAFTAASLPNDGVGLARLEFIISHTIGVHPRALLEFDSVEKVLQKKICKRMYGYPDPITFYIARLVEGIGTIAAAFYPKPVIIRFSDFKSNEYAALIGGEKYEPKEENPMLGFRGAARYYSDEFADCFRLECRAIKKVREDMGLDNVHIMLPFVRSTEEVQKVTKIMGEEGLSLGEGNLKLYLMCEIPANALLADNFLHYCDGFSIGSNDLTQLTLGVDRDSGLLPQFDERNPALKVIMAMAIKACRQANKYIGICGQAPSDFPDITEWLIENGITSIALNPDSLLKMMDIACQAEAKLTSH